MYQVYQEVILFERIVTQVVERWFRLAGSPLHSHTFWPRNEDVCWQVYTTCLNTTCCMITFFITTCFKTNCFVTTCIFSGDLLSKICTCCLQKSSRGATFPFQLPYHSHCPRHHDGITLQCTGDKVQAPPPKRWALMTLMASGSSCATPPPTRWARPITPSSGLTGGWRSSLLTGIE